MANGLHSRPQIHDYLKFTTMTKSQSRSRRRRIIQHTNQSEEPPPRLKLTTEQPKVVIDKFAHSETTEEDEGDPFYYYDLTSSSDTESESHYTHVPQGTHFKARNRTTFREERDMPEVREWQWVCCCVSPFLISQL